MKYFITLLVLVSFISCNDDDSSTINLNQTDADIIRYLDSNNLNAQKTTSGVYYIIDEEGTGDKPNTDSYVTLKYEGYLLDGTQFESTNDEEVSLDLLYTIPGFSEGLTYFNEGSKGTILIPPSLAFGDSGASDIIPGGAVLIFNIEIASVINAQNEDDILEYLLENDLEAERTDSGLYYIVETLGDGNSITENSAVTIKYTGTLTNGTIFDQSSDSGSYFYLQNTIPGFSEGISLFKEGGKGTLIIPPSLAYGENGSYDGTIPRNAIVIFEFEIL
ncbi:FKBP-type peptidyl-prolyl cis-trans isomerase [Lutibacter sp. A64]|uniref:FKBP-type peptidyl-prolyl cis-trans isomerase n=1 Tax=Lutibacter sp. A64 TaxID=2918526 RepID=UPI001F0560D8|nr:FKBP-type peptidyl-prolyl cis-trans isomerase [Lutibacter sp. A64]UMB53955.1 FKBP-type peptidyl-prolyl cis-trans isomerase [Lutibacter sp. A64]